jgi:hypothetical protein
MNFVSRRFIATSYLVFFRNEGRIFLVGARGDGMLTIRSKLERILLVARGLPDGGRPTALSPGGPGFFPKRVA